VDFNLKGGGWIVQVLELIEACKHLKIMVYSLVLAVLLWAIRWW